MHCHIAWHTSEGLAVQLLEGESGIPYDHNTLSSTCASWDKYMTAQHVDQVNFGI